MAKLHDSACAVFQFPKEKSAFCLKSAPDTQDLAGALSVDVSRLGVRSEPSADMPPGVVEGCFRPTLRILPHSAPGEIRYEVGRCVWGSGSRICFLVWIQWLATAQWGLAILASSPPLRFYMFTTARHLRQLCGRFCAIIGVSHRYNQLSKDDCTIKVTSRCVIRAIQWGKRSYIHGRAIFTKWQLFIA